MKVGCYCRVSILEQNFDWQIESAATYSQSELDMTLSELQVYRDKAIGIDTSREDYKRLMGDVEAGEVDTVAVREISRPTRSFWDLDRTVSHVMESGATIRFVRDGPSFGDGDEQPTRRLQIQMLGTFAE